MKSKVAQLKKESDECLKKKQDLEELAELTQARLGRAEKLTSLLVEEGHRWVETVEVLKVQIHNQIGDVFLSSAAISYLGPFTGMFRQELIETWLALSRDLEIPLSEHFSTVK